MKLPTMVIIFNKEMADKIPCGVKCAFSAHAAVWLEKILEARISYSNRFGGGIYCGSDNWFSVWISYDYRKLIMASPDTIENLFEKFKKAGVPVYCQKTSHDIHLRCQCQDIDDNCLAHSSPIKSGTPICLSVFFWKDEHKKLIEGCELL